MKSEEKTPERQEHFDLKVTITKPELVEWLKSIPENRLQEEVEKTLSAGYLVLNLIQASSTEEAMRRFFRPVVEKMEDVKNLIDDLLNATKKSQKIGELGEKLVLENLQKAFPEDRFDLVSKEAHTADIKAYMRVGLNEFVPALIEVKLYSGTVSREEVNKFLKDLKRTNIKYGLMVSLTSPIAGKGSPIHVMEEDDLLVIFVPEAGINTYGASWGYSMLKAVALFEKKQKQAEKIFVKDIEEVWSSVNQELENFRNVLTLIYDLKTQLGEFKEDIEKYFTSFLEKIIVLDTKIKESLNRISEKLRIELLSIISEEEEPDLPIAERAQLFKLIEQMREKKEKALPYYESLINIADEFGLDISVSSDKETNWTLMKNNQKVLDVQKRGKNKIKAELLINKTKILLVPESPIEFFEVVTKFLHNI